MKATQLAKALSFTIANKFPVLVTGKPGIGKTDIIVQAALQANARCIITHPVVSDPTDYKGLPYADKSGASFLPFGDLRALIDAKDLTVYFMDDLGQAPAAVQAAIMQLILCRRINGHKVSDNVVFVAATNRKQDRAGVTGMLEPVKSRFASIIGLDVDLDDWCRWALTTGNMPVELVSFIRFRPELLDGVEPSKDIINTPSPRTIANLGKLQNAGCPTGLQREMFSGAVGDAFAAEYKGFLDIFNELPDINSIFLNPDTAHLPERPDVSYALTLALAGKITPDNSEAAFTYIKRMNAETQVSCVKDAINRDAKLTNTKGYISWACDYADYFQ